MMSEIKELNKLIGKKVIAVEEYDAGAFYTGIILIFEDGLMVEGIDGEYRENVLAILTEEQYKNIKTKEKEHKDLLKKSKAWTM